jgi:spore germination protein
MSIRAFAILAFAAILAVASVPALAAGHRQAFDVTGYASDWTPTSTLEHQSDALSVVGVDGVGLASTGATVGPPTNEALLLLATAHANGLRATLLIGNWGGPEGVSEPAAARLLSSPHNRAYVADKLAAFVRTEGWDGITIDLESLATRDGPGLVAFAKELRWRLPQKDQLAVDVAAKASVAADVAAGYLLPQLSREADVVLMAYDEHGPWSGPGAIGGMPWVERTLNVARGEVPPARLVLGVAAFGFSWHLGKGTRAVDVVTDPQARVLAMHSRRSPRWNSVQGEWTASIRGRTVLWWSDSRSVRLRESFAKRLHLGGVAIWQLASADQLPPD